MTFRSSDGATNLTDPDLIRLTAAQLAAATGGGTTEPPPDDLVPHLPAGKFHTAPSQTHPYDFVRRSRMTPRPVPFTLPLVAPGVLAASKQGKSPTRVVVYPLFSPKSTLYGEVQNFTNGRSDPINKEFGDDLMQISHWQALYPNVGGPRGINRIDSYCSAISHPFLDLSGVNNPRLPLVMFVWHNRFIGAGYPDGSVVIWGAIPGTLPVYQTCSSKADRAIMYAAELGSGIIKIDRTKGKAGGGKTEDPSLYDVTMAWPCTYPTAVDTHTNGDVYYIDSGDVYRNGSKWAATTHAFALVVDSPRNRLLVLTDTMVVYSFDLSGALAMPGPQITVQAGYTSPPRAADFFTIDVDENGTNGVAGMIRVTRVHTNGNCNLWQITPDLTAAAYQFDIVGSSSKPGGWQSVGDLKGMKEWFGHYDWLNHFHRFQGLYFGGGYGDNFIVVTACDPPLPPGGTFDRPGLPAGSQLDYWGKVALSTSGLTSVVSIGGESPYLGCSFDEMAELPFDAIQAFLIGGMITETPRPELASIQGVMAVCTICLNSQRALREGKPFLDACFAWAQGMGLKSANYPQPPSGSPMVNPQPLSYLETDGTTIMRTDQGRSTPIRYIWPPLNKLLTPPVPADAKIVIDRGVAYVTTAEPGTGVRARVIAP